MSKIDETVKTDENNRLFLSLNFPVTPLSPDAGYTDPMYASSNSGGVNDTPIINRGVTGSTAVKPFISSKLGEGLHAFAGDSAVLPARPADDALVVVAGAVLGTKPVRLDGTTLTSKQVHAFCDHIDQLIRARVFDSHTFTLLTTPQSIMAMGLRFMTSKVMARTPVTDWKTKWSVATILDASDSFVAPMTSGCSSPSR